MTQLFVTSDEHYGHEKIIEYVNRPFSNAIECQEAMIKRHNEKVPDSPNMLTIHVGDMFWPTMDIWQAENILRRLHGKHAFIWGNHDKLIKNNPLLQSCFVWCQHMEILNFRKHKLTLCHYAMRVWESSHKGSWHVYGHSHGDLPGVGKSFDIGVDCNNFTPWSIEEIAARMDKLPNHHVIPEEKRWPGKIL
jgi:calcineurin-like phosphoesterase family protein